MSCDSLTRSGKQCSREGIYAGCCSQHILKKSRENAEGLKLIDVKKANDGKHKLVATFEKDGRVKNVSFGAEGYVDFTLIKDREEAEWTRHKYWNRHAKDLKTMDPTRPGLLSLYILWGEHQDVKKNVAEYRKMFSI
jgi:hypothetical protein